MVDPHSHAMLAARGDRLWQVNRILLYWKMMLAERSREHETCDATVQNTLIIGSRLEDYLCRTDLFEKLILFQPCFFLLHVYPLFFHLCITRDACICVDGMTARYQRMRGKPHGNIDNISTLASPADVLE